jgi:hypothetical protein
VTELLTDYHAFLDAKRNPVANQGPEVDPADLHPSLFDFQRQITAWAIHKGRAAIFADTGLGKTRQQVEWAHALGVRTLILAPLAVAGQTVREAAAMGRTVTYAHDGSESPPTGITITNYERLERFDPADYEAVVLDESSILKAFSVVTKKALISAFAGARYRLCCTATPAPNDIEELCNHAHFLGLMTPAEMRSTFFIADSRGEFMRYRLKRHAHKAFYRWLSSWSMAVRRPSDLGFSDEGFDLPPLEIVPHFVATDYQPEGRLFVLELEGITEASMVRHGTLKDRVAEAVRIVEADYPDESWLIWCGINEEADAIRAALDDVVEVRGSDTASSKEERLLGFANGDIARLVTKASVAGFGMNFQRCARMIFVGLGYSFEQYYQAIRRCWRYGQTRPVVAHVVLSEPERSVYDVILKKERQHERLAGGLLASVTEYERAELFAGTTSADTYEPTHTATLPAWLKEDA